MIFRVTWTIAGALCFGFCTFAQAVCPVDVVIVKGRIDHAPRNASVRVQLLYSKGQVVESGEVAVEGETFNIPIEFLTQSRKPVLNFLEKCERRPKNIIVALVENGRDQEYDRVFLDFGRDFTKVDTSAYAARFEIVLHGSP